MSEVPHVPARRNGTERGVALVPATATGDPSALPATPADPDADGDRRRPAADQGGPAVRRDGAALTLAFLGMATIGFNRARLGGLTISDLLFALCGAVIAVQLLTGRDADLTRPEMRRTSPPIILGSVVLLTAGTVSSFVSWDPLGSMQVVLRFAWLTLVWFWILRTVAPDRRAFNRLLSGWRIAIIISSVAAILGQIGLYSAGSLPNEDRQMAFYFHPNELASLLAFGLPLFLFDVPRPIDGQARSAVRKLGLVVLVVWAISTTGSMTAFASALVGVATCGLILVATKAPRRSRRRNPLVPMALALGAVVGMFALSNSDLPVIERFTRFQEGDSGIEDSIETREERNAEVIERLDDTLLVGTGLQLQGGQYGQAVLRIGEGNWHVPGVVPGVHNMFLKLLHEGGVPSLVGLAIIILTLLNQTWRLAINARGTDLYPVAVALLSGIVASNTMANFAPIAYQRYYWIPAAMASALWAVRRQELRAQRDAELSGSPPPRALTAAPHPS